MQDLIGQLAQLRRPKLLIEAARIGADNYNHSRDLPKLIGTVARSGPAMMQLFDMEKTLNDARIQKNLSYRPAQHLSVLIALLGECRLIRAGAGPDGETSEVFQDARRNQPILSAIT